MLYGATKSYIRSFYFYCQAQNAAASAVAMQVLNRISMLIDMKLNIDGTYHHIVEKKLKLNSNSHGMIIMCITNLISIPHTQDSNPNKIKGLLSLN